MRKRYLSMRRFFVAMAPTVGMLAMSTSCVNNDYDLDKEMDLTMNLIGSLSIPLGETSPILLSDMLDTDDIDMLEEIDGQYKITLSDQIEVDIDQIAGEDGVSVAAITGKELEITTDFESPDVPDFNLDISPTNIPVSLDIDEVSLGNACQINSNITVLVGDTSLIPSYGGEPIDENFEIAMDDDNNDPISIEVANDIVCPDEVISVTNIEFGSVATVSIDVSVFADLFTSTSFSLTIPELTIEFPKGFVVAYENDVNTKDDNIIVAENLTTTSNILTFNYTIVEYDEPIGKTNDILDGIVGDITFSISDEVSISGTTSGNPSSKSNIELTVTSTVKASDMTLEVANIEVEIEDNKDLTDPTSIDLPDLIKSISYITLDSSGNKMNIYIAPTAIPDGLTAAGDDIQICFPYPKFILETDDVVKLYNNEYYTVNIPVDSIMGGGSGFNQDVEILELHFDSEIVVSNDDEVSNYIEFDPEIIMLGTEITIGGSMKLNAFNEYTSTSHDTSAVITADTFVIENARIESDDYEAELSTAEDPETFDIKEVVSIPDELVRVDSMLFKDRVYMNLSVDVALSGTEADLKFVDYTIEFPKFLTFADDVAVDSDNKMVLNNTFDVVTNGRQYNESFEIVAIDFTDDSYSQMISTNSDGEREMTIDELVSLYGSIKMNAAEVDSSGLSTAIIAKVNFGIDEMEISKVYGIVEPSIPAETTTIDDIAELYESLEGNLSLVLSNPTISITATNTLSIPIAVTTMSIIPMSGDTALDAAELTSAIEIPAAEDGGSATVDIFIYDDSVEPTVEEGVQYVPMSGLKNILADMPDLFEFSYEAAALQVEGENHMIDLYTNYSFSMAYDLNVPLTFDELSFEYTTTIEDLSDTFESMAEVVSSVELDLSIENSMPIALSIAEIKTLDADGKELSGLLAFDTEDGAATILASSTSTVTAILKDNAAGDLERIDSIELSIAASIDSTEGGAELRSDQYIVISMAARLPEGITIDLNDTEE